MDEDVLARGKVICKEDNSCTTILAAESLIDKREILAILCRFIKSDLELESISDCCPTPVSAIWTELHNKPLFEAVAIPVTSST